MISFDFYAQAVFSYEKTEGLKWFEKNVSTKSFWQRLYLGPNPIKHFDTGWLTTLNELHVLVIRGSNLEEIPEKINQMESQ